MSAAVTAPTTQPHPASADQPSHSGRLLNLVRRLIDHGKQLAASFQQGTLTNDLASATRGFGTRDIALILARITQGLLRATALEARIVRGAAHLDAEPRPFTAPALRQSRPAQPSAPRAEKPDPRLALLPSPEQIAAEVRRRPIGAVIADICRDLGITANHPLWREISDLVIWHGGNLATMFKDLCRRVFATPPLGCDAIAPAPRPPAPGPASTGPP